MLNVIFDRPLVLLYLYEVSSTLKKKPSTMSLALANAIDKSLDNKLDGCIHLIIVGRHEMIIFEFKVRMTRFLIIVRREKVQLK